MAAEHNELKCENKLYNYLHDFGGNGIKQWEN